ncbi:MAG: hypothetical protein MI864_03695 [Pseudomonadales bacterium]|nr:hypothetical protein [Pseudomonadales bacterium]
MKLHNNSQTRFRSVITGPEGVFEWHSTKNYAIDNQSQPCEFRVSGNIESMEDGCQWIELETLLRSRLNGEPLPDEGGVNYFSAIARGVSANRSLNNLWHETGYFDVIVNNWMGLVSFVDSVSDPYYVFESQGQVVEGAFPIFEDNASTPNTRDEAKNLFTAFPRRPLDLIKSYSGSLPK